MGTVDLDMVLSLMTLFLSCATICNELDSRQIVLTLTKADRPWPISGGQMAWYYGVEPAVGGGVAGAGVYAFTEVSRWQEARDESTAVRWTRRYWSPEKGFMLSRRLRWICRGLFKKRLEQLRIEDPSRFGQSRVDLPTRRLIEQSITLKWHTIAPRDSQRYLFTGLGPCQGTTAAGFSYGLSL